jgi:hypothetical protein
VASKQETTVIAALNSIEQDMQHWRREKLRKLNILQTLVALRPHQIHSSPDDKNIVLEDRQLSQLAERCKTIVVEKGTATEQYRQLKRDFGRLERQREERGKQLAILQSRLREVQRLKFGKLVDLEKLEDMDQKAEPSDAEDKLANFERERSKQMSEMEVSIAIKREYLY